MKNAENFYLNRAAVLFNEGDMIPCSKALAMAIGTSGALFLQQLHFRIRGTRKAKSMKEGRYWYFCTLDEWVAEDFPFWSKMTIRRLIDKLKEDGVLIVGEFNKMSRDRTHWYTINYSRMWEIENSHNARAKTEAPCVRSEHLPCVQSEHTRSVRSEHTITLRKKTTDLEKPHPSVATSVTAPIKTSAMDFAITVKPDTTKSQRDKLTRKFDAKDTPPSMGDLETFWRSTLTMYDYNTNLTFGKQEIGNMRVLRKEIEGAGVKIHHFLEYCVQNWKTLRAKITWENKEKSKLGETPAFRSIFFNRHDILAIMKQNGGAKKEEKKTRTFTRVQDLPAMHPARREQLADMIQKLGSVTI